jgi:hypothetical protein
LKNKIFRRAKLKIKNLRVKFFNFKKKKKKKKKPLGLGGPARTGLFGVNTARLF